MSNQSNKNKGVELLCIGTELLLGEIVNSNAQWLAEELAILGIPHYIQTVVGDNPIRLKEAILDSAKRSEVLITTGGLGPTPDDITTATIAEAFETPLKENSKIWAEIKEKTSTNSEISASSNKKQSLFPLGAQIIPNPSGTAPGFIWSPKKDFTIICFPGVPSELKKMWVQSVASWLREYEGAKGTILSSVFKFSGISESTLAEQLSDLLESKNPTVAPYASSGEVKIRLTAQSSNSEAALKLLKPLEKEILNRTGLKCYGSNNENLASVVLELLRKRGETLAIAESCSGGGLGAALTAVPKASEVFLGGVIAYSNKIKQALLHVEDASLQRYGAVSNQVAKEMAKGVKSKLGSNWSIAISGLAGPGGETNSKPVGQVHIAIAGPKTTEVYQKNFGTHRGRLEIQKLSVICGLDSLRLLLLNQS